MRPAVPLLRFADKSVTFIKREEERATQTEKHIQRERKTSEEKLETHATVIMPRRSPHNTNETTKWHLLEEGDNQAWREHRFVLLLFCI